MHQDSINAYKLTYKITLNNYFSFADLLPK